jgi:hypothetical protein
MSLTKAYSRGPNIDYWVKENENGAVSLIFSHQSERGEIMTNTKFVVRVNHGGTRAPAYVQRFDGLPAQMTTNRKLALLMGKLTAEDAAKAIENSRCVPELVPVHVNA